MSFQYIICFGSRRSSFVNVNSPLIISIHHMFWFELSLLQELCLVFYFNTSYVLVRVVYPTSSHSLSQFQYIICFGSSWNYLSSTSKVIRFQYIICFGSRKSFQLLNQTHKLISIHHMFWFENKLLDELRKIRFISIHHMFWFEHTQALVLMGHSYFNTSYVLVRGII